MVSNQMLILKAYQSIRAVAFIAVAFMYMKKLIDWLINWMIDPSIYIFQSINQLTDWFLAGPYRCTQELLHYI